MATLGIDYGSSYTAVSWINPRYGKPETVKFNGDGSVKYPSVIMGIESGLILGYQALNYLEDVYQIPEVTERFESLANFIPSLKRILSPNGVELIGNEKYSHLQLLTIFFSQIKELAQNHCGNKTIFDSAIVSHPVGFSEANINLLKQALVSSGFNNVDTKLEPIAAILGYSNEHEINNEEGILIFDYGGGTIDVAYVKKRYGQLKLLCEPRCDMSCGGQDLDILLYEDLRKKIKNQYSVDISSSGMIDYGMLNSCRKLKEINVAKLVVEQTKQKKYKIDKVLLIGGSSQLTLVRKMLNDILPDVTIDTCGEKDVAVALGNITGIILDLPNTINKEQLQGGSQKKEINNEKSTPLENRKAEGDVVYIHNDDGKLHLDW